MFVNKYIPYMSSSVSRQDEKFPRCEFQMKGNERKLVYKVLRKIIVKILVIPRRMSLISFQRRFIF